MKIAVNARLLNERKSGPYRYLVNILNELSRMDNQNTYYLLLNKKVDDNLSFICKNYLTSKENNWR